MARRKVALNTSINLHIGRRPFRIHGIVDRHAIRPGRLGKPDIVFPCLARKGDDRQAGMACLEGRNDLGRGFQGIGVKIRAFQGTGPAVEQFHTFRPGIDLG